jgi:hypothetical protein
MFRKREHRGVGVQIARMTPGDRQIRRVLGPGKLWRAGDCWLKGTCAGSGL